jgi:acetoin utilization deacetylase AcuC-like enzyme
MARKSLWLKDPIFLAHDTGTHPENHQRLQGIEERISQSPVMESLIQVAPRPASMEELRAVHFASYIDRLRGEIQGGASFLDSMDTVVSPSSWQAALAAAGAGPEAADRIMAGEAETAFCAVRPPGHHAEADHAMGFCLLNNIAVTARYLQNRHQLEKILIFDFDVHHGNATEHMFYDDQSVYYISIHQFPLFPGTGSRDDKGKGRGMGYNRNFPMAAGKGNDHYWEVVQEVTTLIKNYSPDFILLSSGFDAHHRDPLAGMNLTSEFYGRLTEAVKSVADSAEGRVISFLEGGYALDALAKSVEYHLGALPR